jgi:TfoX/Sxy family transcriptional regulator of competence genes
VKWIKAPEELKVLIGKLMAPVDCEKRPMFGYPAYFINKNMFAGLFQDKLFVRLSPDQLPALKKAFPALANLEPMPGRPMKDYHVIPEQLYKDARKMPKVLQEAAAWCRTLPAKAAKPKAAKKPAPPMKGR